MKSNQVKRNKSIEDRTLSFDVRNKFKIEKELVEKIMDWMNDTNMY